MASIKMYAYWHKSNKRCYFYEDEARTKFLPISDNALNFLNSVGGKPTPEFWNAITARESQYKDKNGKLQMMVQIEF